MVLVALGMTPPVGRVRLHGDQVRTELDPTDELRRYHHETRELLHSLFRRSGFRVIDAAFVNREGTPHPDLHFSTAHQVGSCRMGQSKRDAVVDGWGAVFDYPGLYVSDGAAVPTSLAVNTAHTILANAERIAAGIRARYGVATPAVSAAI
jgi:choline dehydrogenase-like flavoprotein